MAKNKVPLGAPEDYIHTDTTLGFYWSCLRCGESSVNLEDIIHKANCVLRQLERET